MSGCIALRPMWCLSYTLRSCVHDISKLFRIFSPQYQDNDKLKCSSVNFPYWPHISVLMENWQSCISMYHCYPIAGRRSLKEGKLWKICPIVFKPFRTLSPPRMKNKDHWYINLHFTRLKLDQHSFWSFAICDAIYTCF